MWVETTSRIASFTRRILAPGILENLRRGHEAALDTSAVREVGMHEALDRRRGLGDLAGLATDDRRRQRGSLPQVVVVGLSHRGAKATLETRLERPQLPALPLEAGTAGEVKSDLE